MYNQTRAIVLFAAKYPKGYMVCLYTKEHGRITCAVNQVSGKRAVFRKVLLQPLSIVDVVLESTSAAAVPHIREGNSAFLYQSVPYDFTKSTVALFLAEFLSAVLRDSQSDALLFFFLEKSLRVFDVADSGAANFHIVFMLKMTRYLGLSPNMDGDGDVYFDLLEGVFVPQKPLHRHFLEKEDARCFRNLMRMEYANMAAFRFTRMERMAVLEHILEYYRLHLTNFPPLKSLAVLQSVCE